MICQNETTTSPLNNSENKPESVLDDSTNDINNDFKKKVLTDTTKISGIYKIINRINGKYYVGSSKNINVGKNCRWANHKRSLYKNNHVNSYLQKSWNKYGKDAFEFIIVEEIPVETLLVIEQKYLNIAKQEQYKCYNLNFLADRIEMTPEVCQKISDANRKRIWTEETRNRIRSNNTKEKHPLWGKRFTKKKCNVGSTNPMFDYTIYTFVNDTNIFNGYRSEFIKQFQNKKSADVAISDIIKGKKKSHFGWKIQT